MTEDSQTNKFFIIKLSITVVIWATVMLLLFPSCSKEKENLAPAILEKDSLPTLRNIGNSSLISDSGLIKYRIISEEWLIYDKKNPPYWAFEKGIFIEKFDENFHVNASIMADTAYYYNIKKLWELRGHVNIRNLKGERFNTELLYWDQNMGQVYSNKFMRIQQKDKILTGIGFKSNQQFTDYIIYNSTGVLPVVEHKDSISRDSIKK
jgi:LPS export ABC transporter protein LptC